MWRCQANDNRSQLNVTGKLPLATNTSFVPVQLVSDQQDKRNTPWTNKPNYKLILASFDVDGGPWYLNSIDVDDRDKV